MQKDRQTKTKPSQKQTLKKPPKKTVNTKEVKPATKKPPEKATIKLNDDVALEIVVVPLKRHKDKNDSHYHVIVDNIDENHVSVGFTTKPKKGKNSPNYKLEKSPLDDGKTSFMRRQGTVAPKGEYKNPRKGTMTSKDYSQAQVYAERAKQKYLSKKTTKKSND